jgi:hypothetical protein
MKTIWKYTLTPGEVVRMPEGAVVLTAREQNDQICIWAEVDPAKANEVRQFEIFGTGHPMPADMGVERKYIGTASLYDGKLIFHVYERTII